MQTATGRATGISLPVAHPAREPAHGPCGGMYEERARKDSACGTSPSASDLEVAVLLHRLGFLLCVSVTLVACSACTHGGLQTQEAAQATRPPTQGKTDIERSKVLTFRGALKDHDGKRLTHVVGVMFGVYEQQEGGAPLWMEVQNVTPDRHGSFIALVGSTMTEGIPPELFDGEKSRWLGMQILLPGEAEQRRIRLVQGSKGLRATRLVVPDNTTAAATTSATDTTEKPLGGMPSTQQDQSEPPDMRRRTNRRYHGPPLP
jgi:hypothetical protein